MPNGSSERHLGAEDAAAEPAEAAFVVALVEARALLEHVGDRADREQHRDQRDRQDRGDQRHHDDARALRL